MRHHGVEGLTSHETHASHRTPALQVALRNFLRTASSWPETKITSTSLQAQLHTLSRGNASSRCIHLSPGLYGHTVVRNSAPCLIRSAIPAVKQSHDINLEDGSCNAVVFRHPVRIDARAPVVFDGVWFTNRVVVAGAGQVFFHQCLFGAPLGGNSSANTSVNAVVASPQLQSMSYASVEVSLDGVCTLSECEFRLLSGSTSGVETGVGFGEVPALTARDQTALVLYNSGFTGPRLQATALALRDNATLTAEHIGMENCRGHGLIVADKSRAVVRCSVLSGGVCVKDAAQLRMFSTTLEAPPVGRSTLVITHQGQCAAEDCELLGEKATSGGNTSFSSPLSPLSEMACGILTTRDRSRMTLTSCELRWGRQVRSPRGEESIRGGGGGKPPRSFDRTHCVATAASAGFYHMVLCERSDVTMTRCCLRLPNAETEGAAGVLLWQSPRLDGIPLYAAENTVVFDNSVPTSHWGLVLPIPAAQGEAEEAEEGEKSITGKEEGDGESGGVTDEKEEEGEARTPTKTRRALRQLAAMWADSNYFLRRDGTLVGDPTRRYAFCDTYCAATGQVTPQPPSPTWSATTESTSMPSLPSAIPMTEAQAAVQKKAMAALSALTATETTTATLTASKQSTPESEALQPSRTDGRNDKRSISLDLISMGSPPVRETTGERGSPQSTAILLSLNNSPLMDDDRTSLTSFSDRESTEKNTRRIRGGKVIKCSASPLEACATDSSTGEPLSSNLPHDPHIDTAPPPKQLSVVEPSLTDAMAESFSSVSVASCAEARVKASEGSTPVLRCTEAAAAVGRWLDTRAFLEAAEHAPIRVSTPTRPPAPASAPLPRRKPTPSGRQPRPPGANKEKRETIKRDDKTEPKPGGEPHPRRPSQTRRPSASSPRASTPAGAGGDASAPTRTASGRRWSLNGFSAPTPAPAAGQRPRAMSSGCAAGNATNAVKARRTSRPATADLAGAAPPRRAFSPYARPPARSTSASRRNSFRRKKPLIGKSPTPQRHEGREAWPWDEDALRGMLREKLGLYETVEAYEKAFYAEAAAGHGVDEKAWQSTGSLDPPGRVSVEPFLAAVQQRTSSATPRSAQASPHRQRQQREQRQYKQRRRQQRWNMLYEDYMGRRLASHAFEELVKELQRGQRRRERLTPEEMESQVHRLYNIGRKRKGSTGCYECCARRPSLRPPSNGAPPWRGTSPTVRSSAR